MPKTAQSTILSLLALLPALAHATGEKAEEIAYFETHIRPVLVEHCYECHSVESGKSKAGLLLDTRDSTLTGGESGPALVPGDAAKSLLLTAMAGEDPDLEMPPDGFLPEEVIQHFRSWIDRGAPDPREGKATIDSGFEEIMERGRAFWSFQPITRPSPPTVKADGWPASDIDRYVLARLEAAGLEPSPPAVDSVFLRRLSIDLTGLPPTLAQQDAFDPDDLEATVDQLLDSPAFGERWGRHWLDIVRYADSSGGGRALSFPDAWRYRDYVIASFQRDKPIDELIREHIAGDLLEAEDAEERADNLKGTGFLALGPHNYELQDKELLDLEIADEQVDTLGRAFLGMTIGCARCHDHKFDPIPTADYYAMVGIFTSTTSVKHSNVSAWIRQPLSPTPEEEAAVAAHRKQIETLDKEIAEVRKELGVAKPAPGKSTPAASLPGIVVDNRQAEIKGRWVESSHTAGFVDDIYIHDDHGSTKDGRSVTWKTDLKPGRYEVRASYTTGTNRSSAAPFTVHHAEGERTVVVDQRKKPSHGIFATLGEFAFTGKKAQVVLTGGKAKGVAIADAVQFLPLDGQAAPPKKKEKEKPDAPDPELLAALQKQLKELESQKKALAKSAPSIAQVMSVKESPKPTDTPIRVRGMVRNFGEVVPRGFLRATLPEGAAPASIAAGSGRRELADWVASPGNPLTARVFVNRVWHHLLGAGIVRSVDNLGTTGELPSHPELLDHLASRLLDSGWSTKTLVREIVLSRVYRQAAAGPHPEDPENRLLSHAHRRRLDAETLRDSVLTLSGQLDLQGPGPSLPKGFKSEFGYRFTSKRRSVYLPAFRNAPHELMATFNAANPNFTMGRRNTSSIPTQALFLLNSDLLHEQSRAAAEELLKTEVGDDRARIDLAYRRTLSRPPRKEELALSLAHLQQLRETQEASDEPAVWAALQHALFACVEFHYY